MPSETGAWMPMYWADYFGDTTHLSTEEHGAYLLLLGTYWRRARPLPDDDKFLAGCTKLSPKKWRIIRQIVGGFFLREDGLWRHRRVDIEILRSTERLNSARANGRAGGLAKSKLVTVTVTEEEDSSPSDRPVGVHSKKSNARPSGNGHAPRGTRWAPDRKVEPDWLEAAGMRRAELGLTTIDLAVAAAKFENYWSAKSGASATKVDWRRTFINWVLNTENPRNARQGSTAHDNFAIGAALAAARYDRLKNGGH